MKNLLLCLVLLVSCSVVNPISPDVSTGTVKDDSLIMQVSATNYIGNNLYVYATNMTPRCIDVVLNVSYDFQASWYRVTNINLGSGFIYTYDLNKDYLGNYIKLSFRWIE